jgi:hypothetical protein
MCLQAPRAVIERRTWPLKSHNESAGSKAGLLVNENKIKYIICTPEERNTFNHWRVQV